MNAEREERLRKPVKGKPVPNGAKPGEVRNPYGGVRKEFNINRILREIGDEPVNPNNPLSKRTKLESVLRKVFKYARLGEAWAVNFIADRTEGKPVQVGINANANANVGGVGGIGVGGIVPEELEGKDLSELSTAQLIGLAAKLTNGMLPDELKHIQEDMKSDPLPRHVAPAPKIGPIPEETLKKIEEKSKKANRLAMLKSNRKAKASKTSKGKKVVDKNTRGGIHESYNLPRNSKPKRTGSLSSDSSKSVGRSDSDSGHASGDRDGSDRVGIPPKRIIPPPTKSGKSNIRKK